ncbi:MAG: hypothetical protein LBF22_01185 [Deltaproteobacteria bacterium]|jgi:hypothetical protein|nr:hypothetical protein [Deltaproteobacteria bacterium]
MRNILLIAVLFYLIIWVVKGLLRPKTTDQESPEKDMVSDALTGVFFHKKQAVTISRGGQTFYFISVENRDAWLRRNLN